MVSQNSGIRYIPYEIFRSRGYVFRTPNWRMLINGKFSLDSQPSSALLFGGQLAFFQPFCCILGIIHGRFFEVQAGCKSNVSLGKRTRPLVQEVRDWFVVKIFSLLLLNCEVLHQESTQCDL